MTTTDSFWKLIDNFINVIHTETDFPVLIYDTRGYIIRATDTSRIGDLHSGAAIIMQGLADEYAVTEEEAARDPQVREGFSCPILVDGKRVAGFGITGKLALATPIAKIASKTINAWIKEQQSQERLACSERKYKNIFDHSLHGIFQATLEGKFITANTALAAILGYTTADELISKVTDISTQVYQHSADRQRLVEELHQADNKTVLGFTTLLKRSDGTTLHARINSRLLPDPETGTTFIEGILEDITEIAQAEAALKLSEEKYSKAFNNCPVWVVLSSLHSGKYIEVNETFLRTMGYDRHEVIGCTSSELGTWVKPEERLHIIETILQKGSISNHEVLRSTRDGRVLTMLFWGDTIKVANQTCLLSVSLDITERKQAEQEKLMLEKTLAHSQKLDAIGQLAGGIAHDFNNMLAGITGAAEMLSLHVQDNQQAQRLLKIILDAATRSADLTKKLLVYSRDTPIASTAVDVHDIIQETTVLLKNTIDRRIRLELHLDAAKCMVIGDPSQLENAFLNLGINGTQAMTEGGCLSFSTRMQTIKASNTGTSSLELKPGRYLEITVQDTGIGIPEDLMSKIFDPFFTTKEQGQGTGLGLAAVYGTIQQHGGAISVSSKEGSGTRFTLLLPLAETGTSVSPELPKKTLGSGRILVVDDEEIMRVTAEAILTDLGYEVILARDGQEAVNIYRNQAKSIDLIVLDMIMPVMNGKDCFHTLQQINPDVRVLLSSGFTREEDLEELKRVGLAGFIRKPYLSGQLSKVINDILGKGNQSS